MKVKKDIHSPLIAAASVLPHPRKGDPLFRIARKRESSVIPPFQAS
ncbi:hypothetical protein Dalk_0892 [Desulfatibacillum aliphaticivorans]|uniref:Uncharacterized protein n=1 Tax=Desulfatibacillum aliphaticivorans TaxID=218208 RepID=B8FI30_DESAL|nr:hypothetical protein Dalk_0892 [Desulfatibacillum aliphaticivorans]